VFCPSCGVNLLENSTFCNGCGRKLGQEGGIFANRTVQILGVVVVIAAIAYVLQMTRSTDKPSVGLANTENVTSTKPVEPIYVPRVRALLSSQVVVPHGSIHYVTFAVDTERMRSVRVAGRFNASGGSGNDIQVFLTDPDGFENLKNGHPGTAFYSTDKVTVGNIDVPIVASGSYVLALSNKFSAISDKYVDANVELRYEERQ
jgi:hypothetical protein